MAKRAPKDEDRSSVRCARIDEGGRVRDPDVKKLMGLVRELADAECGPSTSFAERSRAAQRVAEVLLSGLFEERDDEQEPQNPRR